jgi:cobalamin biosynthesis protein CobT
MATKKKAPPPAKGPAKKRRATATAASLSSSSSSSPPLQTDGSAKGATPRELRAQKRGSARADGGAPAPSTASLLPSIEEEGKEDAQPVCREQQQQQQREGGEEEEEEEEEQQQQQEQEQGEEEQQQQQVVQQQQQQQQEEEQEQGEGPVFAFTKDKKAVVLVRELDKAVTMRDFQVPALNNMWM